MPDPSIVDDWLDKWESLQESGQAVPLDQFIEQHCPGAPPEMIRRLRDRIAELRSMDARLQAAGLDDSSGDAPRHDGHLPARGLDLKPGDEPIPGYRLEARLGEGGFGEVWRANGPGGFPVALKFLRLERPGSVRELRALESLKAVRHPHLLAVFGAWRKEDCVVIAMELAQRTLWQRLQDAMAEGNVGIPRQELLGYMIEAAEGLDYLHKPIRLPGGRDVKSIQHLDVKPQNLLLTGEASRWRTSVWPSFSTTASPPTRAA